MRRVLAKRALLVEHVERPRILAAVARERRLSPRGYERLAQARDARETRYVAPSLGVIAYQFRVLRALGAIVPAGTRRVRGAVETYYVLADAAPALADHLDAFAAEFMDAARALREAGETS